MNILKITHSYYPENNAGVELYVHSLVTELLKDHKVMLYTRSRSVKRAVIESNGQYTIIKNPRATTKRGIIASLKQCIHSFKPDVVHIHHLMGLDLYIPLFLQKLNIPYVISLHDYWFICPRVRLMKKDGSICNFPSDDCSVCMHPENILKKIVFRYKQEKRRKKILNVLNNAAYLGTPSMLIKKRFLDYGVRNRNFNVSPLGINLEMFRKRAKNVLNKSDVRIGFIGTISIFKGIEVLIKAFELLNSGNMLYLYGKMFKGDRKQLGEKIKKNSRIVYEGEFDHRDIMSILRDMDILVVPSICEESHCLVIDEGRAAGIPVIASAIGAVPERITDGKNGFLVEPGNVQSLAEKIQWLIDNYNDVLSRMDFTYKIFSMREDAEYHEDIYRRVLKRELS